MKSTGATNITKKAVRTVLAELGKTPNAIAASLKKRRIKGVKEDVNGCPLALYLKRKFKNRNVAVNWREAYVGATQLPLTKNQTAFIALFDQGKFPGLVTV